MINCIGPVASSAAPNPDMNFDSYNCNSLPAGTGWRRKGEWRWQRPS
jgi:hypothetical protein